MCAGAVRSAEFWTSYARFEESTGDYDAALAHIETGKGYGAKPEVDMDEFVHNLLERRANPESPSVTPNATPVKMDLESHEDLKEDVESKVSMIKLLASPAAKAFMSSESLPVMDPSNEYSFALNNGDATIRNLPNPFSFTAMPSPAKAPERKAPEEPKAPALATNSFMASFGAVSFDNATSAPAPAANPFAASFAGAFQGAISMPSVVPSSPSLLTAKISTPNRMTPSRLNRAPRTPLLGSARRVPCAPDATPEEANKVAVKVEALASSLAGTVPEALRVLAGTGPAGRVEDPDYQPEVVIPDGASKVMLAAVNASPAQMKDMGTMKVLTPVRRSIRNVSEEEQDTSSLLQETNHVFVPNSNMQEVPGSPLLAGKKAVTTSKASAKKSTVKRAKINTPKAPDTEGRVAALLNNDRYANVSPVVGGFEDGFDLFGDVEAEEEKEEEEKEEEKAEPLLEEETSNEMVDVTEKHKAVIVDIEKPKAVVEISDDDFSKYLFGSAPSPSPAPSQQAPTPTSTRSTRSSARIAKKEEEQAAEAAVEVLISFWHDARETLSHV